jgi:plastocyanin
VTVARLVGGVLLGIVVAACSSSTPGGSAVATTTVDLPASYRYAPADIAVAVGATVTWMNRDNFTHSVAFLDGGLPREPLVMKPGEAATFTFASAGLYHYQCHLHPQNMRGSVTVIL